MIPASSLKAFYESNLDRLDAVCLDTAGVQAGSGLELEAVVRVDGSQINV